MQGYVQLVRPRTTFSFSCFCYLGYLNADNRTCSDHQLLVVASHRRIEFLNINKTTINQPVYSYPSKYGLTNVAPLDFDYTTNEIFYGDSNLDHLGVLSLEGNTHRQLINGNLLLISYTVILRITALRGRARALIQFSKL